MAKSDEKGQVVQVKYEVRTIGLWSFVKISFFLNLALGFLIGIFVAMQLSLMSAMFSQIMAVDPSLPDIGAVAPGAILFFVPIMMAFFMAFFNTIFGSVAVLLYNLAAKAIGGLEMTLEPVTVTPAAPQDFGRVYAEGTGAPPPPPGFAVSDSLATPVLPAQKPEPPAGKFE